MSTIISSRLMVFEGKIICTGEKYEANLSTKAFREMVSLRSPPASCVPLLSGFSWMSSLLVINRNPTGKERLVVLRISFLPDSYHPCTGIILDDIGSPLHSTFHGVLTSVLATTHIYLMREFQPQRQFYTWCLRVMRKPR